MDILREVCRILEDGKQFDGVYLCSTPELSGRPASNWFAVGVEVDAVQTADQWDGGDDVGIEMRGSLRITFLGRHDDPLIRDSRLDRLVNVVAATLSGKSLLGITVKGKNKFTAHRWAPAKPPERRVVSTFVYSYLVKGWANFDVSTLNT
jgi:hypothetical protein